MKKLVTIFILPKEPWEQTDECAAGKQRNWSSAPGLWVPGPSPWLFLCRKWRGAGARRPELRASCSGSPGNRAGGPLGGTWWAWSPPLTWRLWGAPHQGLYACREWWGPLASVRLLDLSGWEKGVWPSARGSRGTAKSCGPSKCRRVRSGCALCRALAQTADRLCTDFIVCVSANSWCFERCLMLLTAVVGTQETWKINQCWNSFLETVTFWIWITYCVGC